MACKCDSCGCEISMEKTEELISKLGKELYSCINKYHEELSIIVISACLIEVAKDLICSKKLTYTNTLGILTDLLNDGLKEQLESHINGEKSKNASNPV